MHRGTLEFVESSKSQAMRTPEAQGEFEDFPSLGRPFRFFAESLTEGLDFRMIETSPVMGITMGEETGVLLFRTENSTYRLRNLSDEEECCHYGN